MTHDAKLGRAMHLCAFSLQGTLTPEKWTEFIADLISSVGMTPVYMPVTWSYPTADGAGGKGETIIQSITESFIAVDTWPDHSGAYLLICSCKPFRLDPVHALLKSYGLSLIDGAHHTLRLPEKVNGNLPR